MNNITFPNRRKAQNTWLAGKIKCGRYGYALVSVKSSGIRYLRCHNRVDNIENCEGCSTLRTDEFEQSIYTQMIVKMAEFQMLTGGNPAKVNPKLTALNVELAQAEAEIEKLIDTLTDASPVLLSYANTKIEGLDTRRQALTKEIADRTVDAVSPEQMKRISGYLENWDSISFEDRRLVVDGLISTIRATSESVQIEWKI